MEIYFEIVFTDNTDNDLNRNIILLRHVSSSLRGTVDTKYKYTYTYVTLSLKGSY